MDSNIIITIISSLLTVIVVLGGVIGIMPKILTKIVSNGNPKNGNNSKSISDLHEKINTHAKDNANHCAEQLRECNEQFGKFREFMGSTGSSLNSIDGRLGRIEDGISQLSQQKEKGGN